MHLTIIITTTITIYNNNHNKEEAAGTDTLNLARMDAQNVNVNELLDGSYQ